jgi:uncharacterized membrane protein
MKSRFQIAGHPIHAMTVGLPIGLYTAALIADAAFVLAKDPFWFRMAFWCIALGLLGNVSAVATGIPDFMAIRKEVPGAWNAATTHLAVGLGLLVLYGINFALHNWGTPLEGGDTILPLLLSLLGAALLGLQGWFGGELVFRHKVGVEEPPAAGAHEGRLKHKGAH